MELDLSLNEINWSTYARSDVIKYYRDVDGLLPVEEALFNMLAPQIKNSKILDLGIGGGRTTKHLLKITDDYTGVDYVPQFAEETARKYPTAKILCGDATDLKEFQNEVFDFVLFSFNGIDSLTHADRQRVMREAHRVLKKHGIFMFSTHNRDYEYFHKLPWQRPIELNVPFWKFLLYSLYHLPNHYRMRKHEVYTDEYAILNDPDHRYSLLLYYISIDRQLKQLSDIGFCDFEVYDRDAKLVTRDTNSHWLYYLGRKM